MRIYFRKLTWSPKSPKTNKDKSLLPFPYLGLFRWYFTREKKKAKALKAQNLGNPPVINRTGLQSIIRAKFR